MAVSSKTLLIVEDDRDIRGILRDILRKNDFYILEAGDGAAGLELFHRYTPDIVLLDLRMPVMDGTEFLEALRADGASGAEIIVITGAIDDRDIAKVYDLGAGQILRKPLCAAELVKVTSACRERIIMRERQREYESGIRALAETWSRAFDSVEDIIIVSDGEGRVTRANKQAVKYFAGTHLFQTQITGIIPAPDEDSLPADPEPESRDITLRGQDFELREYAFMTDDGLSSWRIHILRDITAKKKSARELEERRRGMEELISQRTARLEREMDERKKAREEAREARENLEGLFNTVEDCIFVVDFRGRILYANEASKSKLGYSGEELAGMGVTDIHAPDKRAEAARVFADIISGKRTDCGIDLTSKSGETFSVETRVTRGKWDNQDALIGVSRDVTESRRVKEELEEHKRSLEQLVALRTEELLQREEMLDVFYKSTQAAMVIYNRDTPLFVNPAFERLVGYRFSELEGKNFLRWVHPEHKKLVGENIARRLDGSTPPPENYQIKILSGDGKERWIDIYADRITLGGAPAGIATFVDITDKKHAEEALVRAMDRLSTLDSLVNRSQAIVFLRKIGGGWPVEYVSGNVSMLGHTADEFMSGKVSWLSMTHPDDVKWLEADLEDKMRGGGAGEFVLSYRMLSRGGQVRWVEDRSMIIRGSGGAPTHLQGIITDVTDKKRAEDALRESERRFRDLVESSADWVWEMDENAVITYSSPMAEAILGYKTGELLGRPPFSLMPPDRAEEEKQKFQERRKKFESLSNDEVILLRKDGQPVYAEVSATPVIDEDGVYRGYRGITRDITERKNHERALSEALERSREQLRIITSIALPGDSEDGVDCLIRSLTELAAKSVGVERASVWILNSAGTELSCFDLYEKSKDAHSSGGAIPQEQFREELECLKQSRFVNADDVTTDPRVAAYTKDYLRPLGIKSMLDVIIRAGGRVFGTLCFEHTDDTHTWRHDEITFACQLADQIALAVLTGERKKAEAALRESERRMSAIIEFLPDATFAVDVGGRVIAWNKAIEEMTGVPKREMIGKGDFEYSMPFYGERRPLLIDMVFNDRDDIKRKYDFVRKSGEQLVGEAFIPAIYSRRGAFIWATALPLHNNDGEIVGAIESIRDITEHKNAQRALSKRIDYERAVFECGQELFVRAGDADSAVESVLKILLAVSGADRVYIFENIEVPGKGLCVSAGHRACAPGLRNEAKDLSCLPYDPGFSRWRETLSAGGIIKGDAAGFPSAERDFFVGMGVRSVLALPIFSSREWRGFVGFDCADRIRDWNDDDVSMLRTAAELIGLFKERRESGRKLRESEEMHRTTLSSISDAIFITDFAGDIRHLSGNVEGIFALGGETPPGENISALFSGKKIFDPERLRSEGEIQNIEVSIADGKGNPHDLLVTVKKLLYKDGSVLYSCRDITKYKKFEEMLHLVRTAVDEAAEAIIITDLEGNLIYSNESFRKFFGDKADLVFNAYNIFPLNLNSEYKYSEQRAFKGWKAETELETIGGGKMSALVNSSIISDTNDIPAYTLFIISDISEQKKAREDARIKHEQLVQADKMKTLGTLVSGVGHEINNPNSFIMLNAPALKEMFEEALPVLREWCALKGSDKVGRFKLELIEKRAPLLIKGVLEGSVRIKNIVQSLKDFARQAPSGLSDGVSVSEVVKSSVALVGNRIKNSTRKFVVEMGDNIPAVRGNFQRLEQVVINLIINAAEALPDKDKGITVKTSFDKDRGFAVIEVADEGRGIPDDIIDQITHPFFTTKRDTGGTGLGLSISNGIVTEHGGFLRFKSKVGNGTSAFVELPVSKS